MNNKNSPENLKRIQDQLTRLHNVNQDDDINVNESALAIVPFSAVQTDQHELDIGTQLVFFCEADFCR